MNQVRPLYDREEINSIRRRLDEQNRSIQHSGVSARIIQSEAICARCYNSQAQTITAGANTALTFDTEVYDTDDLWASGAATKFYATHEGYYTAGASISLDAAQINAADILIISVALNGTTTYDSQCLHTVSGQLAYLNISSGPIWMNVGDYLEFNVWNGFAANKTITAAVATSQNNNTGWITRLA